VAPLLSQGIHNLREGSLALNCSFADGYLKGVVEGIFELLSDHLLQTLWVGAVRIMGMGPL
jgi:hypothetical protein